MFNTPIVSVRTLSPLMQQTRFIKSITSEAGGELSLKTEVVLEYLSADPVYDNYDLMGVLLMGGEL